MPYFRYRALVALTLLLLPWTAKADYLSELQQQSREAGLSDRREWHDLLHYRPDLLGGYTSLADTPVFFHAPDGKSNPQAELDATLAAFFDSAPDPATNQPKQCRLIARYQWLKSRLRFDPARLPEQSCARFDAWYAAMAPRQVTLIYPAAYLNGPSSMFGHTLLRIDNGDHNTQLFAYALNFAAATDEANGLIFAVRGLFGGYPGYFSTAPYYEKVKEYNNLENRDIWEYELNYTPDEIRHLLEHAWELGQVDFDYFFFKENCSYQLLALMDVARPGHNLADRFRGWAIPSDTVREILAEEGLLREARYRPSNLTRIRYERAALNPAESELALALATDPASLAGEPLAAVSPERRATVLDLAYDYLQYRTVTEHLAREKVAGHSMNLLRARAKLPPGHLAVQIPTPPDRPDLGHDTARLALGLGRRGDEDYLEIRLRPAYHDLLDPLPGYTPGAQINFLDIRARATEGDDGLELEAFRIVDIFSITGRDDFFHPWSWRMSASVERTPLLGMKNPELAPMAGASYGVAYAMGESSTAFALADGLVVMSDHLPHDYSAGAGPYAGISVQDAHMTLLASARTRRFSGVSEWMTDYVLETGYTINRNLALRLSVQRTELAHQNMTDSTIGLHGYF